MEPHDKERNQKLEVRQTERKRNRQFDLRALDGENDLTYPLEPIDKERAQKLKVRWRDGQTDSLIWEP